MKKKDGIGSFVSLELTVRFLSWLMIPIAIITIIMTFLSTFSIYVTTLFDTSKTLIAVLCITFLLWAYRSLLESYKYPSYRFYSVLFLILSIVSGYLLTTSVF